MPFVLEYNGEKRIMYMSFLKKTKNTDELVDTVFSLSETAKKDFEPTTVNATIGTLYDENGQLFAFDSVFAPYDEIPHTVKAAYASAFKGNENYRQAILKWVFQDKKVQFKKEVIATPGGTGAVALAFSNFLEAGQTVLIPEIAWPVYQLMASEHNLKAVYYSLFEENHFNLNGLKKLILEQLPSNDKFLLVINDPCQNPTGYSLSLSEWQELVSFLNSLPKDKHIILLNDVAYMDYTFHSDGRAFLEVWNELDHNILALIAYSCSKSFTSYGMRLGALLMLHQKQEVVDAVLHVMDKQARSLWSNISNSGMENIANILIHPEAYLKEKDLAVQLLKKRADLFMQQADACGLRYYPFKEGFFLTLVCDEKREAYHQALIKHHIYCALVPKGIRIALCSLPLVKIDGLAKRLKEIQGEL